MTSKPALRLSTLPLLVPLLALCAEESEAHNRGYLRTGKEKAHGRAQPKPKPPAPTEKQIKGALQRGHLARTIKKVERDAPLAWLRTGASTRTRRRYRNVPTLKPTGPFERIGSASLGGGAFTGTLGGRTVVIKPLVSTAEGNLSVSEPREHYWIHKEAADMGAIEVLGLADVVYFPPGSGPSMGRPASIMLASGMKPRGGRLVKALVQVYEPELIRQDSWDSVGVTEANVVTIIRQIRRIGMHWPDIITNPFLARNSDGTFRAVFIDIDPGHWHSTPNPRTLENAEDIIRDVVIPYWFGLGEAASARVVKAVYGP